MDVGVLCTECKDNVVKPDKLNYTMSSNFPPLRASMEAGAVLNQEVVKQISARLQAQREFYESPIGRALLGKKVGDKVEIKTPVENSIYKIAEIS